MKKFYFSYTNDRKARANKYDCSIGYPLDVGISRRRASSPVKSGQAHAADLALACDSLECNPERIVKGDKLVVDTWTNVVIISLLVL